MTRRRQKTSKIVPICCPVPIFLGIFPCYTVLYLVTAIGMKIMSLLYVMLFLAISFSFLFSPKNTFTR